MRAVAAVSLFAFAATFADLPAARSTFREARATSCKKCDIVAAARAEASDGATDCGWAKQRSQRGAVNACAQAASAAKRDFLALSSVSGIDSSMVVAVVSRTGSLHQIHYDDDITGGMGVCEGGIWRYRCSEIELARDLGKVPAPYLDCTDLRDQEVLCRECETRRFELGPIEDADELR